MKTTVISFLGTQKDAHGGPGPSRWSLWRPTIGLVMQDELEIDELHLILDSGHMDLAEKTKKDVLSIAPRIKIFLDIIEIKDPWDFEEVYSKLYDYAKQPCFHEDDSDYLVHISTGSHVEQICLFS